MRKVLVIEDNETFALMLCEALREAGYQEDSALSCSGGLKTALNWLPDLVLLETMAFERLLTTLSTLVSSGVSIMNAVSVIEGAFNSNLILQNVLKRAKGDIAGGRSISESFKASSRLW